MTKFDRVQVYYYHFNLATNYQSSQSNNNEIFKTENV